MLKIHKYYFGTVYGVGCMAVYSLYQRADEHNRFVNPQRLEMLRESAVARKPHRTAATDVMMSISDDYRESKFKRSHGQPARPAASAESSESLIATSGEAK